MTMTELIVRYESGAIASHEFVIDALNLLDPGDPAATLGCLPSESLNRLSEFVDEYRPGEIISSNGGTIPSAAQVLAAKRWLDSIPNEVRSQVRPTQEFRRLVPGGSIAPATETLQTQGTS